MRLISQDGMIDIPYQRVVVSLSFICNTEIVGWWFGCPGEEVITLGNYSTEAKALKVMEMLRNAYCGKVIFQNVTIEEDVLELMKEWKMQAIISKTDSEPRIEYINNNIFVFPKDSEVEV